MGKPTGFKEIPRELPKRRPVELRILDWNEIYNAFPDDKLAVVMLAQFVTTSHLAGSDERPVYTIRARTTAGDEVGASILSAPGGGLEMQS